ncbi:MAG TPA: hypothetical protein VH989_02710 [Actinomycetota bacterium]|jgi:hypothetical protein
MRLGRRQVFFLGVSLAFLALLPPTPPEFRWVNLAMAALAGFWFVLLTIEQVAARRAEPHEGDQA